MSSSGVLVNPNCQQTFSRLSEGKKDLRYIIFNIEDKEVNVEVSKKQDEMKAQGDDYADNSKAAYEEFCEELKELTNGYQDCRYAVFDFKFSVERQGAGTSKKDVIVFLQLCPDTANIKKKMIYASSASAIKAALTGSATIVQFQISEESEISHKELLKKLFEKFSDK